MNETEFSGVKPLSWKKIKQKSSILGLGEI